MDNAGGSLVITGSRIEGNNGGIFGGGGVQNGGPQNLPGSVLIVSGTIIGNVTGNEGGGIFSGQNGHPSAGGQAAATPRVVCSLPRCAPWPIPPAAGLVLTVTDGSVPDNFGGNGGGGIAAEGPADVIGSVIDDDSAGGAVGGGLFNVGSVRRSTIWGNRAVTGGGIEVFPRVIMTIAASTLDSNHSGAYGAAIGESGTVEVTRSTIALNTAGGRFFAGSGAAVELEGGAQLQLSNSTLTGNITHPAGGGAIGNYGGLATLSFDTLAGNSGTITGGSYTLASGTILAAAAGTVNCAVPLHETAGYNLSADTSCALSMPTGPTGVDPDLGPLAANGGPARTRALMSDSPAIDAGGLPATSRCPLVDQRGRSRPWGPACDIGAFELHYGAEVSEQTITGITEKVPRRTECPARCDIDGHSDWREFRTLGGDARGLVPWSGCALSPLMLYLPAGRKAFWITETCAAWHGGSLGASYRDGDQRLGVVRR